MSYQKGEGLVSFDVAFKRLAERFAGVTPGEVSLWIRYSTPFRKNGEDVLPAYLPGHAGIGSSMHGKGWISGYTNKSSVDIIKTFLFRIDDVNAFKPSARWLSFEQLKARWECDERVIEKRIRDSGYSQLVFWPHPLRRDATLSESMFLLKQVEDIEKRFAAQDDSK